MVPRPHQHPHRFKLDRIGVVLSGLCMVHCVAGLVLVGVLGLGGGVLLAPEIHRVGLLAAMAIAAATLGANVLRSSARDHALPLALGFAGLALMGLAVVVQHGTFEALVTIGGVALVASAHLINLRRAQVCC